MVNPPFPAIPKHCHFYPFYTTGAPLLHRILPTAAEHRVLQDVCDAIGVLRRRAEDHAEGLVLVGRLHHGQQLGAWIFRLGIRGESTPEMRGI